MAKLGKVWSFLCHLKFFKNKYLIKIKIFLDFPGCTVDKNPPASAGDRGWIPGGGRSHVPRAHALQQEKAPQWEAHGPQQRVVPTRGNYREPLPSKEDSVQPINIK